MRLLAILAAAFLATSACAQQTGIYQSYIVTAQDGTINAGTSYGTSGNSNIALGASNGAAGTLGATEGTAPDLGTYNIFFNTLTLNGQILTFENGGGDATGAFMSYRIYPSGSPGGAFTQLNLGISSNAPFTDVGGTNYSTTGDQLWANGIPVNLLAASGFSGVGSQQYTLEVFFSAATSLGARVNDAGGNNFYARFTVVPEPSTYAAGALLAGLVGWQVRRRKAAAS